MKFRRVVWISSFCTLVPSTLSSTALYQQISQTSKRNEKNDFQQTKELISSLSDDVIHSASETLSKVLRGDVASYISADLFGQTLAQESAACPPLSTTQNLDLALTNAFQNEVTDRKLYGGAQYHRTIQLFHNLIETFPLDDSTADEIALLLHGMSPTHDGADLLRSVATLSSRKISIMMEEILNEMARRIEYVFMRMWDVIEYALVVRGSHHTYSRDAAIFAGSNLGAFGASDRNARTTFEEVNEKKELITHDMVQLIKLIFQEFVRERVSLAYHMARDDMNALFRYVSWDLAFGDKVMSQKGSLTKSVVREGAKTYFRDVDYEDDSNSDVSDFTHSTLLKSSGSSPILDFNTDSILNEVIEAVRSTDNKSSGAELGQTCAAVNALVHHVTCRWRKDLTQIVCSKFNTFCLLPFHQEFISFLRRELENKYTQNCP